MGTCRQGWVANCTQYIFFPEVSSHDHACTGHGSLATRSQVINTAGLCNDCTFCSGLQAPSGSPDRFSSWAERWVWAWDYCMTSPMLYVWAEPQGPCQSPKMVLQREMKVQMNQRQQVQITGWAKVFVKFIYWIVTGTLVETSRNTERKLNRNNRAYLN